MGDAVFDRFTAGKDEILWYYRSLADGFQRSELDSWLADELDRTVAELKSLG